MSNRSFWKTMGYLVVFCAVAISLPAQDQQRSTDSVTFTSLLSFDLTNGENPSAGLVQAIDGNLYGTTLLGGVEPCWVGVGHARAFECNGTIFEIAPTGTLNSLYQFRGYDHSRPLAGLVQGTSGDFYGITSDGEYLFEFAPPGSPTFLYRFGDDGESKAGLVQATNGNFYGTTAGGGANGYGTVFEITPKGKLTTLYSFCAQTNCADGQNPQAELVQATNGNFYGTTAGGGANGNGDYGTVFEITPGGTLTTLYSFCAQTNCTDGAHPAAGLVQATNGNFYGTTYSGGANGDGTVFEITPKGKLTTLYSFCAQTNCADGQNPQAGLVQATDGNFYGTTAGGGANGDYGTVFEITPGGTLTTLYSFCAQTNCADGADPVAGLVQATNGNFYGTTYSGGANGDGTVFSLSVGLGPFVQPRLTMGKVGAEIVLLGNNLTGASGVSFNGKAASYEVVSGTEITTKVPSGATTGTLTVTTPIGALNSNGPFYVMPQLKSFTPTNGPVGTQVQIKGVSLRQTTGVSFGGVAAEFTVVSNTEVTATVPTGAVTGTIAVTTLGGSITSTAIFTVTE